MKKNLLYGGIGALFLSIPYYLVSFLGYMSLTSDGLNILFGLGFILGSIITAFVLLHKNDSAKHALIRSFILFTALILLSALISWIGANQFMHQAFGFVESDANDRASGLGMGLFLYCLFGISLLSIIAVWIKKRIKERKRNRLPAK